MELHSQLRSKFEVNWVTFVPNQVAIRRGPVMAKQLQEQVVVRVHVGTADVDGEALLVC